MTIDYISGFAMLRILPGFEGRNLVSGFHHVFLLQGPTAITAFRFVRLQACVVILNVEDDHGLIWETGPLAEVLCPLFNGWRPYDSHFPLLGLQGSVAGVLRCYMRS